MEKHITNRDRQAQHTRGKLLAAMRTLLATRPYTGVKISEISRMAKVSVGTFYVHFPSKRDALRTVIQENNGELVSRYHFDASLSAQALYHRYLEAYFGFFRDLGCCMARNLVLGMVEENFTEADSALGQHREILHRIFAKGREDGSIRACRLSEERFFDAFLVMLNGVEMVWFAAGDALDLLELGLRMGEGLLQLATEDAPPAEHGG